MKGAFILLMVTANLVALAQHSVGADKPTLAFGPWYNKKVASFQISNVATPEASELAKYAGAIDSLRSTLSALRKSNDDCLWQSFITTYDRLSERLHHEHGIAPFVIEDSFLHGVVLQASRHRRAEVSLRFIDEAKRIHPRGIYRSDLNCKH